MPTLMEKIEANASKCLDLPPKRRPGQELSRYKNFLKVENHRLKILHRGGGSGLEVCRARASVLDVLLRYLWATVLGNVSQPETYPKLDLCLVALGGYGRGELNPQSDVDIMFLHNGEAGTGGKPHPMLSELMDNLLYILWDIGLKVGHSVRTVEDCVKVAQDDMQSKTSLIEARLITGSRKLFERLERVVVAKCVHGREDAYIAARLEDQAVRRAKYGNSATMLEPNIKNGCGGLRDYQNLLWMAFFKYRARSLADLKAQDQISDAECKQLEAAYDFLMRVRNELHYTVNRSVDVLTKAVQPTVGLNLDYTDRSVVRRIERFMRDVYQHMRNIYLITRTLEQRLALVPQPSRLPSFREIIRTRRQQVNQQRIDGFRFNEGEIYPVSATIFKEEPRRLMRVFLHAQQRGLKLHPDLAHLIRNQLHLVDRSFIKDSHVHETFLEILDQRGNVAPILRAMHETEFLGKYMPEFGKLTCLVQHEFYHRYTVDEHTLQTIEKLDRIWDAHKPPFTNYTAIFRDLERPYLLYLALLLHDSGKADPKINDHIQAGVRIAQRVAKRMKLPASSANGLLVLIENHVLMAQISQRRDLDDPAISQNFAKVIKTPENLEHLTLMTFVDSMATSENLWNDFKESLLWALFRRTMPLLTGGKDFIRQEAKQRAHSMQTVSRLAANSISREEVEAHFNALPSRYFQIHSPREILADITLTHHFMQLQLLEEERALEPAILWHDEPDRGYAEVKICTWDRAGLFSTIAGSLSASGLNILSAQIFSRTDGIVIDTLFAHDATTGKIPDQNERNKFEKYLKASLMGEYVDFQSIIRKMKNARPVFQTVETGRIETLVEFDNDISETRTVIEVQTEDRVGLLYMISRALLSFGLDIAVAKICTEKGAATDTFYVTEADGRKLTFPPRMYDIEQAIRQGIAGLDRKD